MPTRKKHLNNVVLIAVCLTAMLVTRLIPRNEQTAPTIAGAHSLSAGTNEQRLAFLTYYGIDCENEPFEIREVVVPLEFTAAFQKYEALQKRQGLSLEDYKGESVRKYCYKIKDKNAVAELLVQDGNIVACAVLALDGKGGFSQIIT